MTEQEIDKVLEALDMCAVMEGVEHAKCPYFMRDMCMYDLKADAAAAIREQREHIRRLHDGIRALRDAIIDEARGKAAGDDETMAERGGAGDA